MSCPPFCKHSEISLYRDATELYVRDGNQHLAILIEANVKSARR